MKVVILPFLLFISTFSLLARGSMPLRGTHCYVHSPIYPSFLLGEYAQVPEMVDDNVPEGWGLDKSDSVNTLIKSPYFRTEDRLFGTYLDSNWISQLKFTKESGLIMVDNMVLRRGSIDNLCNHGLRIVTRLLVLANGVSEIPSCINAAFQTTFDKVLSPNEWISKDANAFWRMGADHLDMKNPNIFQFLSSVHMAMSQDILVHQESLLISLEDARNDQSELIESRLRYLMESNDKLDVLIADGKMPNVIKQSLHRSLVNLKNGMDSLLGLELNKAIVLKSDVIFKELNNKLNDIIAFIKHFDATGGENDKEKNQLRLELLKTAIRNDGERQRLQAEAGFKREKDTLKKHEDLGKKAVYTLARNCPKCQDHFKFPLEVSDNDKLPKVDFASLANKIVNEPISHNLLAEDPFAGNGRNLIQECATAFEQLSQAAQNYADIKVRMSHYEALMNSTMDNLKPYDQIFQATADSSVDDMLIVAHGRIHYFDHLLDAKKAFFLLQSALSYEIMTEEEKIWGNRVEIMNTFDAESLVTLIAQHREQLNSQNVLVNYGTGNNMLRQKTVVLCSGAQHPNQLCDLEDPTFFRDLFDRGKADWKYSLSEQRFGIMRRERISHISVFFPDLIAQEEQETSELFQKRMDQGKEENVNRLAGVKGELRASRELLQTRHGIHFSMGTEEQYYPSAADSAYTAPLNFTRPGEGISGWSFSSPLIPYKIFQSDSRRTFDWTERHNLPLGTSDLPGPALATNEWTSICEPQGRMGTFLICPSPFTTWRFTLPKYMRTLVNQVEMQRTLKARHLGLEKELQESKGKAAFRPTVMVINMQVYALQISKDAYSLLPTQEPEPSRTPYPKLVEFYLKSQEFKDAKDKEKASKKERNLWRIEGLYVALGFVFIVFTVIMSVKLYYRGRGKTVGKK